jgi:hypothetical protein
MQAAGKQRFDARLMPSNGGEAIRGRSAIAAIILRAAPVLCALARTGEFMLHDPAGAGFSLSPGLRRR